MFDKQRFNAVREAVLHFPYWNSADAGIVRKDELQGRDRRTGTTIILNIYLFDKSIPSRYRTDTGRGIFISRVPASGCQRIFSTSDKKQTDRQPDIAIPTIYP